MFLRDHAKPALFISLRRGHSLHKSKISMESHRVLTKETINQNLIKAQYAVRGELAIRAEQLKEELRRRPTNLPFKKIIFCNIGNPQQLGQKPITFFRQMLSLLEWPELLNSPELDKLFPSDVISRTKEILKSIGTVGAYSHSQGIPAVREAIAKFIEKRDGVSSDPGRIYLTNGASDAVGRILELIITNPKIGVMIPTPQYPLYSALISLLDGTAVHYHLDESQGWSLNIQELQRSLSEARANGTDVRVLCLINPGNPTGGCLSEKVLKEIISFCKENQLVLLSDEVYQMNTYKDNLPFISARRVACEMGEDGDIEIFSLHSTSKGLIGECGHRGGYYECHNIDPFVIDQLYKQSSIYLCSNVPGQILLSLMVNPPKEGDPSYELYHRETCEIWGSLKRRAEKLKNALEKMDRVTCQEAAGAMYLFPKIDLPERFIHHAKKVEKSPDTLYALDLLNATGICIVPGSGFGQVPGTYHIRTTILPSEGELDSFVVQWEHFHKEFIKKWQS